MADTYLFGDGDAAALRLELLARLFESSTRAFVATAASASPALVVDLGCGPGFTTRLIAETLGCERTIGLDKSDRFIALARSHAGAKVSFVVHDVCEAPFPCGPADLIFCRFLLTHISNPASVLARWATALSTGGIIMIEETEAIRTANPVFAEYVQIVERMLASESNRLYAGPTVAALAAPNGMVRTRGDLAVVPVSNAHAARMFRLNMQAWKDSKFIQANYSARSIHDLEASLQQLAQEVSKRSEIEWTMRQVVFGSAPA